MISKRLAGVAGDGHLFRVAPELAGQTAADGFKARVEHRPHIVGGVHVLDLEVAYLSVHHDLG